MEVPGGRYSQGPRAGGGKRPSTGKGKGQAQLVIHDKRLLLGIDLGASRTAVMSNRGTKESIPSVVGYPKDLIGVKLLGEPYVVGRKALEMESRLGLRHPFADATGKEYSEPDLAAARHLLSHVIKAARPERGDEIHAVIGLPVGVSAVNKERLLRIARETADLALAVSEPFLVAYGLGRLENTLIVDIGAGTVDICAIRGAIPPPRDQVSIAKAGNFVDQMLVASILKTYPGARMDSTLARSIKEKHSFVGDGNDGPVVVGMRTTGGPVSEDVTELIGAACESLIPEIVEGIGALVRDLAPADRATLLGNIVLAGGGSRTRGLETCLAENLKEFGKIGVSRAGDPVFDGSQGALELARNLPPEYWRRLGRGSD